MAKDTEDKETIDMFIKHVQCYECASLFGYYDGIDGRALCEDCRTRKVTVLEAIREYWIKKGNRDE